MSDYLFQAYAPLLFWTGLGILLIRVLPDQLPRLLGRSLYWVGVPVQIFTLARQTDFSGSIGLAPFVTIAALLAGGLLGWLSLSAVVRQDVPEPWQPPRRGSFILSSTIGNTGFVGLAIAPVFVDPHYLGWIVFYSVTHNVVGTYGLGVLLASYYGRSAEAQSSWLTQLRDILTVPSLWAFAVGLLTRSLPLPQLVETGLHRAIWVVIPCALLLMGMRLSQLQGWKSLRSALIPTALKVVVIPALVGLAAAAIGLSSAPRLALVLMSGMPTAFAGLILAEEYQLDRDLIASSIVLTTGMLLVTIPLWLWLFS